MSTSVTGRVVDDSGNGIPGLQVTVRGESEIFTSQLGTTATTDSSGNYTVTIPEDPFAGSSSSPRKVGVHIFTVKGTRELSHASYDDPSTGSLSATQVTLRAADVTGWAVSLPGSTNALPIRNGNALRPLIDDQTAWGHVAQAITGAQKSILVMQLTFDLPKLDADVIDADPEIVLSFPASFDPANPVPDLAGYQRPEILLLNAAQNGRTVRVMIGKPEKGLVSVVDGVLLLAPLLIGLLLGFRPAWTMWNTLWAHLMGPDGDADAVEAYFKIVNSDAKAITFKTGAFSVLHAKAVLIDTVADGIDNAQAIVLGSPFEQSYWDTNDHLFYEPRRGSCAGEPIPVHDVSLSVRGPGVADLQQEYLVRYNRDSDASDKLVALDPPPAEITTPGDSETLASVQLVRTVNNKTLPGLDDGEQGILEAYLRAIENATQYIYIENQYFTDEAIGRALAAALKREANLQVIVMVNVLPDMPFYPTWQNNLIERIRRDAGTEGAKRFSAFTAWSHATASAQHHHTKPVIMPNYLHTKTAIVDGKWATIGSANLDGASLDEFEILRPLQFGDYRNDELNYLVFNDIEGCPATTFVDDLRLALWSEHLGIDKAASQMSSATLSAGTGGWLKLWTDTATAKLQALITDPTVIDPTKGRVLAYPASGLSGFGQLMSWSHPHANFLESSKIGGKGVDLGKIDLVEHTTAYNLTTGVWADD
jgi:phosphatidylserine/phosphatidylglycerophosphate/cardiolipin synthase-like enzyme